ncbi:[protein-PII] uridylyltransferase [Vibrio astriarenae]|nr:[protein-PII] uridylyltransferase [Vibrio sp. C7]
MFNRSGYLCHQPELWNSWKRTLLAELFIQLNERCAEV